MKHFQRLAEGMWRLGLLMVPSFLFAYSPKIFFTVVLTFATGYAIGWGVEMARKSDL